MWCKSVAAGAANLTPLYDGNYLQTANFCNPGTAWPRIRGDIYFLKDIKIYGWRTKAVFLAHINTYLYDICFMWNEWCVNISSDNGRKPIFWSILSRLLATTGYKWDKRGPKANQFWILAQQVYTKSLIRIVWILFEIMVWNQHFDSFSLFFVVKLYINCVCMTKLDISCHCTPTIFAELTVNAIYSVWRYSFPNSIM